MLVYFDTNVFDHLEQAIGVTGWDLYRIQKAIKHSVIQLVLSSLTIEETLFMVPSQPARAAARVKLILALCDKHLFVRGQEEVMNNAIRAYAHGLEPSPPFIALEPWMELEIRNIVNPVGRYARELQNILAETRRDKSTFYDFLIQGRAKVKPMADTIGAKAYPFENYWKSNSVWLAEALTKRTSVLAKVRARGVGGLLKIKCVALAVGANLSLIYSHHLENRTPASGDSRDILHAVSASAADIFVTNDSRLERILARIHVDGFKVMNLRAFLDSLPRWV